MARRLGEAKDFASGSARNFAPKAAVIYQSYSGLVWRGVCMSGGAKLRHLYQDKHTPRSQGGSIGVVYGIRN